MLFLSYHIFLANTNVFSLTGNYPGDRITSVIVMKIYYNIGEKNGNTKTEAFCSNEKLQ